MQVSHTQYVVRKAALPNSGGEISRLISRQNSSSKRTKKSSRETFPYVRPTLQLSYLWMWICTHAFRRIYASIICTNSQPCTNIDTQYKHEHERQTNIDKQYIHEHEEHTKHVTLSPMQWNYWTMQNSWTIWDKILSTHDLILLALIKLEIIRKITQHK